MNIQTPKRMTVDEFLVWAKDRQGRFELIDGVVREMAPETSDHADAKAAAYAALKAAIKRAGLKAYAKPDGMTVRISKHVGFEPDALVYMPPRVDGKSLEIPNPIIVVEVGSPSTRGYDAGLKLKGYMSLPSMHHILIIDADAKFILHHKRVSTAKFETVSLNDGILRLDPPGIDIPVADFFDVD